ncbi:hypothetical protein GH714_017825 [Hevea brasiliensis]|uniref:Rx N-terminal domain-containing protein n=1 Tax=Hevea brasiliensis TaxID=3981 RepID=A0A6A6N655_HEVBR|nr:hypothetical protein GH714_017825 [Hevea brasiliensis]
MVDENEELLQKCMSESEIEIPRLTDRERLEKLRQWLLNLKSLRKLFIASCLRIVSLPDAVIYSSLYLEELKFRDDEIDMNLPTCLASLTVEGFEDLKYLSNKGFQSLASLECLRIERCLKLVSFPKYGLPPSLLELHIYCCPLLEQRYQKSKKQQLSELARIPFVEFE